MAGRDPRGVAVAALAIATVLTSCRAEAAGQSRTYVPLAARNGGLLEYVLTTPTPVPSRVPLPTATPTANPQNATLRLASVSTRSSSTYRYVYAKVENLGPATAYRVRVTVTFRNASGAITGVASGDTRLSMLRPGEFSTASILAQPAADSTTYDVLMEGSTTPSLTYVHDGLDVDSINTYRTGSTVYVVGRVTNRTGRALRSAYVDVGVYSPSGTVLDSDIEYPFSAGSDVPNGASANFSASFFDFDERIPAGYGYTVRSEGYTFSASGAPPS